MPTALFFDLNTQKREKILAAGISQFAAWGYDNSSTNRIVEEAGISKGSLFKYFPTKEDFYFYVLDTICAQLISHMEAQADSFSKEVFQRIIDYSRCEFSWYIQNPEKAKLIIAAFTKSDTDIYRKTVLKYGGREREIYFKFLQQLNCSLFSWDRQKTLNLLLWFLKGFNQDFLSRAQETDGGDLEELEREYTQSLSAYIEMLKAGLVSRGGENAL